MPERLEARYRIVTPMFIGGADQRVEDGIRPPSIKGALRFWWRALEWGRVLRDSGGDQAAALRLLHREEAALFGSASDGAGAGQGRFLLRAESSARVLTGQQLPKPSAGHQYLLGQGLYHFRNGYLRSAIEPGELRLTLRFRPQTAPEQIESIARALLALGLLGGLGSRARKGFGALAIQHLDGARLEAPRDASGCADILARLLSDRLDQLPPFSAFSGRARVELIEADQDDPWRLLGELGSQMQLYRSWGQNGQVAGVPAERNFPEDHDLALVAASGGTVEHHPERLVFGLPHNYFFSSTKDKLDINAVAPQAHGGWSDIGANRRASPLFLHPHVFPSGACVGLLVLLPAQFLPQGWRIGLKGKGPVRRLEVQPEWEVLHAFMDRFAKRQTLLEARP